MRHAPTRRPGLDLPLRPVLRHLRNASPLPPLWRDVHDHDLPHLPQTFPTHGVVSGGVSGPTSITSSAGAASPAGEFVKTEPRRHEITKRSLELLRSLRVFVASWFNRFSFHIRAMPRKRVRIRVQVHLRIIHRDARFAEAGGD